MGSDSTSFSRHQHANIFILLSSENLAAELLIPVLYYSARRYRTGKIMSTSVNLEVKTFAFRPKSHQIEAIKSPPSSCWSHSLLPTKRRVAQHVKRRRADVPYQARKITQTAFLKATKKLI